MRFDFPHKEPAMRRFEDEYSPEEIRRMREEMDQSRERQLETKRRAREVYEEMKRRDPEFWKAFGFATENEYLRYYDLDDLIKP